MAKTVNNRYWSNTMAEDRRDIRQATVNDARAYIKKADKRRKELDNHRVLTTSRNLPKVSCGNGYST